MELTNEQISKILELADKKAEINPETATSADISKALIEIEKKMNFFDVDISFAGADKNALIVDDLELSLYQLNQLMKKIGIRSFVARSKEEAKAEIIKHHFDFLLIDLFLPDCKDGISLITEAVELKKQGKQDYKIIVISGSEDKELIEKCYQIGADGYVIKSENWHTDILKYINTSNEHKDNELFIKKEIGTDTIHYSIRKFNDKKIYEALTKDINAAIINGFPNVLINMEKVAVFDNDNTYILAEIYKLCQNSGGSFLLINPSEKIKEAMAFAYLEGMIPVLNSIESAKEYIADLKKMTN
ncbi:MAG: response regulator [Candidatus Gastranaerophilales bacterium]|nr:response regulator [Candidatus Gastranaerophilales bacterium]